MKDKRCCKLCLHSLLKHQEARPSIGIKWREKSRHMREVGGRGGGEGNYCCKNRKKKEGEDEATQFEWRQKRRETKREEEEEEAEAGIRWKRQEGK